MCEPFFFSPLFIPRWIIFAIIGGRLTKATRVLNTERFELFLVSPRFIPLWILALLIVVRDGKLTKAYDY